MGSSICKDCFKTVPTPPQQDHEMNNMPQNHLKPHPHRREVSRPVGITENVLYIEELNIEELKTLIEQIPFTLPQSFQFNFKPSPIKKRLHLKLKPNLIIKSPNLKLKSKKPKTKKKMDTIMEKPKKKISLKDIEISPLESSSAINLLRSFSFKPELESEILIYANNIILEQTESLWALNHNNPYQHIKLSEYEVLSLESPFSFKLQNKVSLQFFLLSIIQLPPEHSINLATLYSHCSIMEKIQEIKYYRAFASKIESIYTMDDSENFPKPIYAFKAVKLQTYGLCSVEDLLRKGYKFTPNQLTSFLKNISGLCYRSEKIGIANRMLIPSNFFLAEGLSDFRIFDYSLACDIGEEKFTKIKGWVKDFEDFWPPELVCFIGKESQAKYNPFLSDVYTLGLTLLCMMGVKRSELSFLKAKEMALEKKLKEYEENGFEDIIKQVRVMLNPKPEQRLSFFQIYENLKKVKSFFLGNLEVVQQIKAEEKEKDAEFFEKLGDLILLVHGETESLLAYDEALGIVTDSNIETKETNLLKIKLHEKIAKCYYRMEDYGSAIIHYIKIMDIQKTILNEEKDLETIRNSILLAQLRGLQMNYNMAGRIYYQSYNKMKELFENFSERPETIFIFKNFGEMLVRIQGLESFGLEFIYKSLELVVKIEGINSHLYFLVLNSIGGCFEIANSIRNASEIYQRIADEARVVYGKVHPLLSKMYGKLALAYQNQSDFQKATLFYKKNLGLQLKIYGENSLEVAENKLLLAKSYLQANEWKKPLKLLRESLEITRRILGEENREVALIQNAIGLVYTIKPNYAKALECYTTAFDILKEINQKDVLIYMEMSRFLEDIGSLYALQKNKTKSLSYYYQSLLMKKDIYGDYNSEVGIAFEKIGDLNLDFEDGIAALENYQNSLEIYEKDVSKNYTGIIRLLEHIGKLTVMESENEQESKQLYEKGINYLIRCMNVQEKFLVKNSEDENEWKVSILSYLASLFFDRFEYEKSAIYMKRSLTILEEFYKHPTNETADILTNIGVNYYKQGKNSEALDYSIKALEIRINLNGKSYISVAKSLNIIVRICKELKDQENEEKYEQMLKEAMKVVNLGEEDLKTGLLRFNSLNNS